MAEARRLFQRAADLDPNIAQAVAVLVYALYLQVVYSCADFPLETVEQALRLANTFGLLHGFGFAGALTEVGLPGQAIPLALLFFHAGVEVGQLLFIAAVLAIMAIGRRLAIPWPHLVLAPTGTVKAVRAVVECWWPSCRVEKSQLGTRHLTQFEARGSVYRGTAVGTWSDDDCLTNNLQVSL